MNEAEQEVVTTEEVVAKEPVAENDMALEEPVEPMTESVEDETQPEADPTEEERSVAEVPTEAVDADDAEEATLSRLADEFLALCEEMEDICSPEDLPDEVWDTAAGGVPLRDAYLRFWYKEYIRCRKAADTRERTAATAVGSLKSMPADPRPAEVAFARSFQTAVE